MATGSNQTEFLFSRVDATPDVTGSQLDVRPAKKTRRQRLLHSLKRGLLYAVAVVLLDAAALGTDSLMLGKNMFHYLTLFTLGEAALLFFLGGALDVGSSLSFNRFIEHTSRKNAAWSVEDHKTAQWKAAPMIVAGVLLLAISFALAYPLN